MKPKLLLHVCCAPCSTSVYEKLITDFDITMFWYNPNIFPTDEHKKRLDEVVRYAKIIKVKLIIDENYDKDRVLWLDYVKKCDPCINFRLSKTAKMALSNGFEYFTTTLSVSPQKNADKINEIGKQIEDKFKIKFYEANFKKQNGHLRSIELSKQYGLYRQNYCGCTPNLKK